MQRAYQGDRAPLEEMLAAHQGLVYALVNRMCWNDMLREELIQAGNLGLLKAAGRFDDTRSVRFSTYAVPWILGEIRSALRLLSRDEISLDEPRGEEQVSLHEMLAGMNDVDLMNLDLRIAIQKLCREEQILICLRYFRDKTQKETSILLRRSQAQISRMERRALDKLRESLN